MLLVNLFLAAYASPVPVNVPASTIPSPVCALAAAITSSRCDPTRNRTIFDILYSCIGVILLCTYISMHHNIPDQGDSWAKVTWMKIRTTIYALLAPEMVILWAIRQRIMAEKIAESNKHRGWTRTHGFFVQMGGLVQLQSDSTYKVLCHEKHIKGTKIPHIPEKEIKDHGKGDLLAKALVIVQTTWFVAQCIARHIQGLVLTEIELITLAFATLNVITYGLWWDKPLNIGYPIYFDENGIRTDGPQAGDDSDMEVKEWKEAWHKKLWGAMRDYVAGLAEACSFIHRGLGKAILWMIFGIPMVMVYVVCLAFVVVFRPIDDMVGQEGGDNRSTSVHPFYAAEMDKEDHALATIYGTGIGILFGAIHLIGWNFEFSTTIELWLWRASSLALTVVPLFLAIAYAFLVVHERQSIDFFEDVAMVFLIPATFLGAPLYFAARIVLLFLSFFALRALPDSAYQNVKWTEYLPHI
ncbi:hypothetical protein AX16_010853 [Volvariella volvacea WC 439]|nr:hypothetical protein AX16_010853 [Volvariella volvacea WC 439]